MKYTSAQVRGAHSGFMKDGYCHTDSSVSCARVMLLRSFEVQEVHDEATLARFAIGIGNEKYFCDTFMAGIAHQQDVELIKGRFSGHADIVTSDTVYELKSVTSMNVWGKVIKGKCKLSNLAQLIGYMWAADKSNGILAYTLYVGGQPVTTVSFAVLLTSKGNIVVNGEQIEYTLADWIAHHEYMCDGLDAEHLNPDQPIDPTNNFFTPCTYCVWNAVCDTFNPFTETTDTFISKCRTLITKE